MLLCKIYGVVCLLLTFATSLVAVEPETFPQTDKLTMEGDLASQMVEGLDRFLLKLTQESVAKRPAFWKRDLSSIEAYDQSLAPARERLQEILGIKDTWTTPTGSTPPLHLPVGAETQAREFELVGTLDRPALIATGKNYEIFAIRWPALGNVFGEGLMLVPTSRKPVADVIAIPDCQQTPEQLVGLVEGTQPASQFARRLAEGGCRVIVPLLINRQFKSPNLGISNREWIYRNAYEMGRGLIGYELQKVLACVDILKQEANPKSEISTPTSGGKTPIGIIGWSEGGLLALYAGAVDKRISSVCVSGYFGDRTQLWQEPLDRNLFGLLEQFGDAELATMIAPRSLILEASKAGEMTLGGEPKPERPYGGPGRVLTPTLDEVKRELARSSELIKGLSLGDSLPLQLVLSGEQGDGPNGTEETVSKFLKSLGGKLVPAETPLAVKADQLPDAKLRHQRQMDQMQRYTEFLLAESQRVREKNFWSQLNYTSPTEYAKSTEKFRQSFSKDVIGEFDIAPLPPHPRTRKVEEHYLWTRYEVVLDLYPDVFAYGLLTVPKSLKAGEKAPVVVCQHGLEGRPQDVIGEPSYAYYSAFATKLAEEGFITFAPQNPYIFHDRFRTLQRKANPLKKTLFSIITPQHKQIITWLKTLAQVDPEKIAFYGLSYGGKTAMRVPALLPEYCLSICSADFNEWINKNVSREPYSYLSTMEYEIFEFNLGNTFNYAEMAGLIAPRPFMVERGHFDGVGTDSQVAYEYAKVRFLYAAKLHIPNQTEIEWFDGPHKINGLKTFAFLHKHLNWPKR